MMTNYVSPIFGSNSFNCPHCNVFAEQNWVTMAYRPTTGGAVHRDDYMTATCFRCKNISIWHGQKMIYPLTSTAPKPHQDIPDDIKPDYEEACSIVSYSPRSACVLLRLCVEKLCNQLVSGSGDLNDKISKLVQKGLEPEIQQALDAIRVIGGQAVHPLEMDLKDDLQTATALFNIVNHIIASTVARTKDIKQIYDSLPADKKKAIENRDNKKS